MCSGTRESHLHSPGRASAFGSGRIDLSIFDSQLARQTNRDRLELPARAAKPKESSPKVLDAYKVA